MIGNYTLTREQAERIPCFYHPELAESDLPRGISCVEHDLEIFPPIFRCRIEPGLDCTLTLMRDAPLVEYVDIAADNKKVFTQGKQNLEGVFGFELK